MHLVLLLTSLLAITAPTAPDPAAPKAAAPEPAATPTATAAKAPTPSEADAELLRSMHAAYIGLTAERGKAHLLLGELNSARYDEKLAARALGKDESAPQAEALRVRLVDAWHQYYATVAGKQPIDFRMACRPQEQTLRDALAGAPGSAAAGRVPAARGEAQACLARLTRSLELTRTRGAAVDAAVAEAKALLATPAPAGK